MPAVFTIQHYIDGHFTEMLSLKELSARFFISASYLSHAFREQVGCGPAAVKKLRVIVDILHSI